MTVEIVKKYCSCKFYQKLRTTLKNAYNGDGNMEHLMEHFLTCIDKFCNNLDLESISFPRYTNM